MSTSDDTGHTPSLSSSPSPSSGSTAGSDWKQRTRHLDTASAAAPLDSLFQSRPQAPQAASLRSRAPLPPPASTCARLLPDVASLDAALKARAADEFCVQLPLRAEEDLSRYATRFTKGRLFAQRQTDGVVVEVTMPSPAHERAVAGFVKIIEPVFEQVGAVGAAGLMDGCGTAIHVPREAAQQAAGPQHVVPQNGLYHPDVGWRRIGNGVVGTAEVHVTETEDSEEARRKIFFASEDHYFMFNLRVEVDANEPNIVLRAWSRSPPHDQPEPPAAADFHLAGSIVITKSLTAAFSLPASFFPPFLNVAAPLVISADGLVALLKKVVDERTYHKKLKEASGLEQATVSARRAEEVAAEDERKRATAAQQARARGLRADARAQV